MHGKCEEYISSCPVDSNSPLNPLRSWMAPANWQMQTRSLWPSRDTCFSTDLNKAKTSFDTPTTDPLKKSCVGTSSTSSHKETFNDAIVMMLSVLGGFHVPTALRICSRQSLT